jgi:hypothetical protein
MGRLELGLSEWALLFSAESPAAQPALQVHGVRASRSAGFLGLDSRPAGAARRLTAAGQMPRRYGSARPRTATQGRPLLVMLMLTIVVLSWVLALHDDDARSEDERNELPNVTS